MGEKAQPDNHQSVKSRHPLIWMFAAVSMIGVGVASFLLNKAKGFYLGT